MNNDLYSIVVDSLASASTALELVDKKQKFHASGVMTSIKELHMRVAAVCGPELLAEALVKPRGQPVEDSPYAAANGEVGPTDDAPYWVRPPRNYIPGDMIAKMLGPDVCIESTSQSFLSGMAKLLNRAFKAGREKVQPPLAVDPTHHLDAEPAEVDRLRAALTVREGECQTMQIENSRMQGEIEDLKAAAQKAG